MSVFEAWKAGLEVREGWVYLKVGLWCREWGPVELQVDPISHDRFRWGIGGKCMGEQATLAGAQEASEEAARFLARVVLQDLPTPPSSPERPHIIGGEFQSDKYPTCPRGKVPLSTKDRSAQDLLWLYAQRRRAVDAEFASDLEFALRAHGFEPSEFGATGTSRLETITSSLANTVSADAQGPLPYAFAATPIVEAMTELLPLLVEFAAARHEYLTDPAVTCGRAGHASDNLMTWLRGSRAGSSSDPGES